MNIVVFNLFYQQVKSHILGMNEIGNEMSVLSKIKHAWVIFKEVSIYPVTGCARRLKSLFNPTMTTNQNRSFNALMSMFVFGAHSRN